MKNRKNYKKNGFTLVELLAVIVVLAIIMLIGVNSVLPMIENKRTKFLNDQLSDPKVASTGKCYNIKDLITDGYLTKVKTDQYNEGTVVVSKIDANHYKYTVSLHDNSNGYYLYKDVTDDQANGADVKTASPAGYTAVCP
jgi:prepilin-type N-terminal cleavage/methylation domain-containing protein